MKGLLLFLLSAASYFSIANATAFAGTPQNLDMCTDTATGCFDLTVNNAAVPEDLSPADYTITYLLSQADASAATNANGEFEVMSFSIAVIGLLAMR